MQFSLVASDFDETLLVGGQILPGTREAIAAFRARGGLFGVCSGRDDASLTCALRQAELEYDFMVCLNGALVLVDGQAVVRHSLPPDYTRCLPLLESQCVFYVIVAEGERVLWRAGRYASVWSEASMHKYLDEVSWDCSMRSGPEQLSHPALQISCRMPDAPSAQELAKLLCEMGLDACHNGTYVDIMPAGVDKAAGVDTICKHFSVPGEQTAVIGDGANDIPMLKKFHGVAMAHASEWVRRQAASTASSVVEALWRIQEEGHR